MFYLVGGVPGLGGRGGQKENSTYLQISQRKRIQFPIFFLHCAAMIMDINSNYRMLNFMQMRLRY